MQWSCYQSINQPMVEPTVKNVINQSINQSINQWHSQVYCKSVINQSINRNNPLNSVAVFLFPVDCGFFIGFKLFSRFLVGERVASESRRLSPLHGGPGLGWWRRHQQQPFKTALESPHVQAPPTGILGHGDEDPPAFAWSHVEGWSWTGKKNVNG